MLTLVSYIKVLSKHIIEEKEKFENVLRCIIEGPISCASLLDSGNFFRFLKSSVDSQRLSDLHSKMNSIHQDLLMMIQIKHLSQKKLQCRRLQQSYPRNAVNELLDMENTEDRSPIAVVSEGKLGSGKTILARAIVFGVDRERYNYASTELNLVSEKNNYKEMQQQILTDAFPIYLHGRKINLRDDADGRDHLAEAFKSKTEKPVFLFIDNALHIKDLEKILPENLDGLPKGSKILITARNKGLTNVLRDRDLQLKHYAVEPLSHNFALKILFKDPRVRDGIIDDLEKIANICKGIPLVLKTVRDHLHKSEYTSEICMQILGALQTEGKIKEEVLRDHLNDFVSSRLDECSE